MIVVEEFPCDSKNQLLTRERFHIEDLHATLNKQLPTRTKKDYRADNAEHFKQYRQDNKEHIKSLKHARTSEKIECIHCNKMFNRGSMTVHIKRKHTE